MIAELCMNYKLYIRTCFIVYICSYIYINLLNILANFFVTYFMLVSYVFIYLFVTFYFYVTFLFLCYIFMFVCNIMYLFMIYSYIFIWCSCL